MKRILAAILILALTAGLLSGCQLVRKDPGKPTIVVTIFPIYDWVLNVLGDQAENYELVLLMQNGSDLHSFTPGLADMQKIRNADLFIYVGGESDDWVPDATRQTINPNMRQISLMEVLGEDAREEETVEGMEDEEHEEEEEAEYDEHIWLSLRNAALFTQTICDALIGIDPENAEAYQANAAAYIEKLNALDARYAEMAQKAAFKTLLFGDRFPFRYLTEDYGLQYYAAFKGCSAETEASFKTVAFLAGKVDELGLPAVMTIEGTNHRIAETVIQATKGGNQQLLVVDSMQSITAGDVKAGADYLAIMESNLDVFAQALN